MAEIGERLSQPYKICLGLESHLAIVCASDCCIEIPHVDRQPLKMIKTIEFKKGKYILFALGFLFGGDFDTIDHSIRMI